MLPLMRWLLYAASALVFLAGFQLFIFTEQTDRYFAWSIIPPQNVYLTAAFLGASYWAAVPVELIAAREKLWARARVAVPAVWTFTTLTLILTVLHTDKFYFSSPDFIPKAAAWFWLAIYAAVPVTMLAALAIQLRSGGIDPPREKPFHLWLRVLLLVQGGGTLIVGSALFAAPSSAISLLLWTLTVLTGRAVGAWLVGMGIAAIHALWENDLLRVRAVGAATLCLLSCSS